MTGPLNGIVVVDLTQALSGPFCTMQLADLGAEVIKVEPLTGDSARNFGPPFIEEGMSAYFAAVNRNKKSVAIDLKTGSGKKELRSLISGADILVENFRPGVLDRLGFSVSECKKIKPSLIYASITGFGKTSVLSNRPAYDIVIQAMGMMTMLNRDPCPVPLPISLGDLAGSMFGTQAILSALYARERDGKGRWVEVPLLSSLLSFASVEANIALSMGRMPKKEKNRHSFIAPFGIYKCKDGFIALGVGNDAQWMRLTPILRKWNPSSGLLSDRFKTNAGRLRYRDELEKELTAMCELGSCAKWLRALERADLPSGKVLNPAKVLSSKWIKPWISHGEKTRGLRHPVVFEGGWQSTYRDAPRLGEHTNVFLLGSRGGSIGGVEQIRKLHKGKYK